MAEWYIKEFGKLTYVTVRTLHHYDEIGLLKPSIRLSNGYRLYSEADLLRLQQINALKFFGFELSKIQEILSERVDAVHHFRVQRSVLSSKISLLNNADSTLEAVISKLESDGSINWNQIVKLIEEYRMAKEAKMQWGTDKDNQKAYQESLISKGIVTRNQVGETSARNLSVEQAKRIKDDQDNIFKELTKAIKKKLNPSANEIQILMKKHFEITERFWAQTKSSFIALAQFYVEDSEGKRALQVYHPKLPQFLSEAMKIYAERELK